MTKLIRIATVATALCFAGSAYATPKAKKPPPPQTHHCQMPDGTTDAAKTKAQCTKAKGKWAKDAPAAKTPDAPAPPATP